MSKPNIFLRILSALWHGADAVRKVLHLVVLLVVFVVFVGVVSGTAPVLPDGAVLEIRPQGFLVEEFEGDPFDRAVEELIGDPPPQTVVQDVVDALDYARDDDRIRAVHLELSRLGGGGLSKLQRIADAIREFRDSGKPVIASADFYSQGGYYIAAQADEVYLNPEGLMLLQGYGSFRTYYKEAIDKLRIDWNIFRVGTHKSYIEPYTRMTMSDEAREDVAQLTDTLWTLYRADVVNARGLDDGAVDAFANDLLALLEASGGDMATAALDNGFVDELLTRKQVRERLIEIAGEDPDFADAPRAAGMHDYLAQMRMLKGTDLRDDNIAIVVAAGEITFGSPSPGAIGADSTSRLLRRALNDDSVAAVVLRIDSPGGSAFASDVIGEEVAALRAAGKPVVASMGSTAASGGYWIAVGADHIVASPATVTGSIGIFGMFPTFQRSIDALGIAVDGTGSTIWSGEFRPDREMSAEARSLLQTIVDDGYDDFVSRVARYRDMDKAEVDTIAQGRVWTGIAALDIGLIDELGDLDEAVAVAAGLAGLEQGTYGRKFIRTELSPGEQLLLDLLGAGMAVGIDAGRAVAPRDNALTRIAAKLEAVIEPLTRFDDPKGIYAHCLCRFE